MSAPAALLAWHRVVEARDLALVADLLAEDCVFHSPALHRPQEGSALTSAYLAAAMAVLGPTLTYRHQWYDETSAVLEFTAELDGRDVHGIDMLRWDGDDRLVELTVMVRPFTALTTLMEQMAAQLAGDGPLV
jgi:hypothetical protein